jgi:hypothetical protein
MVCTLIYRDASNSISSTLTAEVLFLLEYKLLRYSKAKQFHNAKTIDTAHTFKAKYISLCGLGLSAFRDSNIISETKYFLAL